MFAQSCLALFSRGLDIVHLQILQGCNYVLWGIGGGLLKIIAVLQLYHSLYDRSDFSH
jgi:hypothetical protein